MDFIETHQRIIERAQGRPPYVPGRPRSVSNLTGHWPHVLSIVVPCHPVHPRATEAGQKLGRPMVPCLVNRVTRSHPYIPGDRGWPETWPSHGIMSCKACHPFAPVHPRAAEAGQKPGRPMTSWYLQVSGFGSGPVAYPSLIE